MDRDTTTENKKLYLPHAAMKIAVGGDLHGLLKVPTMLYVEQHAKKEKMTPYASSIGIYWLRKVTCFPRENKSSFRSDELRIKTSSRCISFRVGFEMCLDAEEHLQSCQVVRLIQKHW